MSGPDIETGLPEWVEVGATFTWKYKPDNRHHGRKFHVRGIVDGQAVLAEWWKHKQRWNYTVEPPEYFEAYGDVIVPKPVGQRRKQAA
jgi:hypothetical protein